MRASIWLQLRPASSHSRTLYPCRRIANRRIPNPRRRAFHLSACRHRAEDDPTQEPKGPADEAGASNVTKPEDLVAHIGRLPTNGSDNGPGSPRPKDPNNYGSASNRARRNRPPKELPPVHIPKWLLERNVTLLEDVYVENPHFVSRKETPVGVPHQNKLAIDVKKHTEEVKPVWDPKKEVDKPDVTLESQFVVRDPVASILATPPAVMDEVLRTLGAGMLIRSAHYTDVAVSAKPHMILYCPRQGASRYLIEMVKQLSVALGKFDFLRLNAQDIAEIGGDYMEAPGVFESNTLSSLGYDAAFAAPQKNNQMTELPGEDEDIDGDEDEGSAESSNMPSSSRPSTNSSGRRRSVNVGLGIVPMGSLIGNFQEAFKSLGISNSPATSSSSNKPYMMKVPQEVTDTTEDLKLGLLVETLLNAPEKKTKAKGYTRNTSGPALTEHKPDPQSHKPVLVSSSETTRPTSKNFIVFIEDYPQINTTVNGGKFLDKLHEVVDAKRGEGQRLIIIGTASTKEMMPSFSKSGVDDLQAESSSGSMRTVIVPVSDTTSDQILIREHKNKIRAINLRHIRDMIRRLAPTPEQVSPIVDDWDLVIDSQTAFLSDLDESVWPMDRVHRVATLAFGSGKSWKANIEAQNIEKAMSRVYASDQAKYKWVREQRMEERRVNKKPEKRERDAEERIRKLRLKCNSHEKKLLHGVIDAGTIRTTFADVRAPPETIDALKTLTSLSLIRPDAFTYGVLATDRIPGLLLYGPPGTGKTLLAKAVAKESGATMLEVSGSDVYDMYVGEGEKNVRAIFSLAKKLAPCIIFIDEADAILGSRGGSSNRTSHRELINQFLREWDGMTELNAFIMVATNRPFDLDEASLRRLPRRLLVDLPVEKDREAILKIHLKDEVLDPEISLSKLASETPFYSGSDLKNLCVAAALACVREEFDIAAEHNKNVTKDTPDEAKYKYAEKRTLHERHFAKGMDEISASVSEDMGSLSAIRKFDEKYGDRRGRRKKLGGYGFKTVEKSEAMGSDAARVRNQ